MRTRFAPTPSGYLHFGNFCNLILTAWYARYYGLELWLRIDDHDQTRVRDTYLADIFKVIELLKLNFNGGPSSIEEFKQQYSQSLKTDYYWQELKRVKGQYNCDCTRKVLAGHKIYPGYCLNQHKSFQKGETQVRYCVEDHAQDFYQAMGDFVLWRKEGFPAYQWVSLVDDRDAKITHLIRGEDLFYSSQAQMYLSKLEEIPFVSKDHLLHHRLIYQDGKKLSKSQKDPSIYHLLKKRRGLEQASLDFCQAYNLPPMQLEEILAYDLSLLLTDPKLTLF